MECLEVKHLSVFTCYILSLKVGVTSSPSLNTYLPPRDYQPGSDIVYCNSLGLNLHFGTSFGLWLSLGDRVLVWLA